MARKDIKLSTEEKIINKVSEVVVSKKRLIIIIAAAVVAVALAVVIVTASVSSAYEKKMIAIADLEARYNTLAENEEHDSDEYVTEFNALTSELDAYVKDSKYASVKALYLKGLVYADAEKWAEGYDDFKQAYELNPTIYLAPVCLLNAGVCAEEKGDADAALEMYNKVSECSTVSGIAAKAMFSAGRIYMDKGNTALAKATFQSVIDNYYNSEYAALAENIVSVM